MSRILNLVRTGMAAAAILGIGMKTSTAGVILTPSAAGVQTTAQPGAVTETFNSIATGTYNTTLNTAVGTLTSGSIIMVAGTYGGAGGTGNYLAVAYGAPVTLNLYVPQTYVGFWWSAADVNNTIDVTSTSGTYSFSTSNLPTGSGYYGNPNTSPRQNMNEQYVYVNLTTSLSGETITSIKFKNDVNTGNSTRFEIDNISVTAAVPEPSSLALAGAASIAGIVAAYRRRRRD